MLRRVKSDVDINIPPKKEILVIAPMSQTQCEMYQAIMQNTFEYFNGDGDGFNEGGKKDNTDSGMDDNSDILDGKSDEGIEGGKDESKDGVKSDEDKENNGNIMNVSKQHEQGVDQAAGDTDGNINIKSGKKKNGKVQSKDILTASERKLRNKRKNVNYSLAFNNNDDEVDTDYYDEAEDDDDESLSAWASAVVESRKREKGKEIKRCLCTVIFLVFILSILTNFYSF